MNEAGDAAVQQWFVFFCLNSVKDARFFFHFIEPDLLLKESGLDGRVTSFYTRKRTAEMARLALHVGTHILCMCVCMGL